jgi:hypothetical protein
MTRALLSRLKVCRYFACPFSSLPRVLRAAGFIPGDVSEFVIQLSRQIAEFAPELTLDFISEVSAGMEMDGMANSPKRISCIHYMSPWIKNLSVFSNATSPHFERSGSRLRDCIRTISELCVKHPEVCMLPGSNILANSLFRWHQQSRSISGVKQANSTQS